MISRTRRFCFLLATTAALTSFSMGGQHSAFSQPAAYEAIVQPPASTVAGSVTGGVQVQNPGLSSDLRELGGSLRGWFSYMGSQEERHSRQGTTMDAAVAAQQVRNASAINQEARNGTREGAYADIAASVSGVEPCPVLSGARSVAKTETGAELAAEELLQEAMNTINMNAGGASENGLIDYQRNLFQEITALCDPQSNGGNASYCSGTGTSFISLGTLLNARAFTKDDPVGQQLVALQQLLYGRLPISINPDLLENPNTEVMNTMVEGERLKAEMSVGQTLFSELYGNRVKIEGTSASGNLRERLEANGWADEDIAEFVDGGLSLDSMYHALSVGSFGTPFMTQELIKNENGLLANILYELKLSNTMAYHQWKMMEAIALSAATTAVMNRDDAIEDLNRRISALNSRN